MQSVPVLVILLSLLQGCTSPQPFTAMSDSPQPLEVASVAATPNLAQEIEFKLSDYQRQHRILLVFAPSVSSADYRQQMQAWQADVQGQTIAI